MLLRGLSLWTLFLASCLNTFAFPANEEPSVAFAQKRKSSGSKEPSYAPFYADCPSQNIIESLSNGSIPQAESQYMSTRSSITNTALKDFLKNAQLPNMAADNLSGQNGPSIGIALSGGGFRAMLLDGGAVAAMDARHNNHTVFSGLLQASDYIVGTDGGAWTLGSMAVNNFSAVDDLQNSVWQLAKPVMYPKSAIVFNANFYKSLMNQVKAKQDAGFNVSLSDYWGRVLGRPFGDTTYGFANVSFSSIADQDWYRNGDFPYPIITFATNQDYSNQIDNLNTIMLEASPDVFGTFDAGIDAFIPTEYLGTTLDNGSSANGSCVVNYDNFGFMMALTSTYFNTQMRNFNDSSTKNGRIIQEFLKNNFSEHGEQVAPIPNPFRGVSSARTSLANNLGDDDNLNIVDTSLTGENLPLWPLLQKGRDVDVIFAVDNSADSEYVWPNGNSLVKTYERVLDAEKKGNANVKGFPYVPSTQSFVSLHYNDRPVFFGCNGRNTTAGDRPVTRDTPPLIIYLPNVPWNYYTNISTDRTYYTEDQQNNLVLNGLISSTMDNETYFGQCVACAVVKRTLERQNITASPACEQCYNDYCWSGIYDDTSANDDLVYDPTPRL
ncbi:phospholipase B Plb1 [Schizosaccharomyces cryophilus OY26]|uniref:Lysophospholipase n=1 Tax=Schizosaccharomyces cryophilus (strain OY26 / ATCC MYA-4695 / CBS 11777 / NBRC 106824 / NRRL Y48691) TaxID=653667 RepID=S9XAM1_SCHCR|nr:phospholipase B Plb1 [Schizosaccharomyces cryophilus OY26]EPY50806.1 phospholipase B Plb1 [Schizosaccharomyces cryophilus OY26]